MELENLKKAVALAISNAENLDQGGSLTAAQAKEAWGEAAELYKKMLPLTAPLSQDGRKVRSGLIYSTYKSEGIDRALDLLKGLAMEANVSPTQAEEMMDSLGLDSKG